MSCYISLKTLPEKTENIFVKIQQVALKELGERFTEGNTNFLFRARDTGNETVHFHHTAL